MKLQSKISGSYFLSSFFWSTLSKVLNAVFGFISVPLLLSYFGKAEYGLLSIATACNGYMHLMDLGMNTGAVKFFSQWEAEGKRDLISRVSRTNASFYLIISVINILGLVALAIWGENMFSVTHEQFIQLRYCFLILAIFSSVSWLTTVYTQLLTAYKKLDFTMKVQCVMVILKCALIGCVFLFGLSLISYFFYLTLLVALMIIPYMIKCKRDALIDSFKPAFYWRDFNIVLTYSIAIFGLSLFQVTASQSRPILLSIFCENGAESVADYRIVEVIPQFIITVCGTFISIFLPRSSEMMIDSTPKQRQDYVEQWTTKTTVLVCTLCFPFMVGAKSILSAYVGEGYQYLGVWLKLWCLFLVVQMHSTPAYSFILANGKTKLLVISTALACVFSMIVNATLCKFVPVGSAIIGYIVYMICLIGVYYYIYKKYLSLRRRPILLSFGKPFFIAILCYLLAIVIPTENIFEGVIANDRLKYLVEFAIEALIWFIPYVAMILLTKTIKISEYK